MEDDNPGPFMRLHLVDGDTIDLELAEGLDPAAELDDFTTRYLHSGIVSGTHVGGSPCAVPTSSILWAEAIC